MAVFTELSQEQIAQALSWHLPGHRFAASQPVAAGIENSTWFVTLEAASGPVEMVFTVCEMIAGDALVQVAQLLAFLAAEGLQVAAPRADAEGDRVFHVSGKPAVVVPRAPGQPLSSISTVDAEKVVMFLARLHQTATAFRGARRAIRDPIWVMQQAERLRPLLGTEDGAALPLMLQHYEHFAGSLGAIPSGWGHFDLFVDNVLFHGGRISAVIDFYHACQDAWLLDLATFLNDWCWQVGGGYNTERLQACVAAYEALRPLLPQERALLPAALHAAALRFWLSRQATALLPGYQQQAQTGHACKDPAEMMQRMRAALALGPL